MFIFTLNEIQFLISISMQKLSDLKNYVKIGVVIKTI